MKRQSGIYKIQSKCRPERIYIGSAVNITSRWSLHIKELQRNRHHSRKLQNHVNKYGIEDLDFSIIEPCFPEYLITIEQSYLDKMSPFFNICKTAGSVLGLKRTKEEIAKGVLKRKGRPMSAETRLKMSISAKKRPSPMKGKHHTEETKKVIREKRKHQTFSIETRMKLSLVHKGNKYLLGKKQSIKTIEKRMKYVRGKVTSEETKQKMRITALKNYEAKKALGLIVKKKKKYTFKRTKPSWNKGLKMKEESKKKLSESRKGYTSWNKGMNKNIADSVLKDIKKDNPILCN